MSKVPCREEREIRVSKISLPCPTFKSNDKEDWSQISRKSFNDNMR